MASNAAAAAPSSDAARTVTRKVPRDAVVVINILRSMASTRVFSSRDGIPEIELFAPMPSHAQVATYR